MQMIEFINKLIVYITISFKMIIRTLPVWSIVNFEIDNKASYATTSIISVNNIALHEN